MLEIYYLMKTLVTTLVAVTSGCAVALWVLNRKAQFFIRGKPIAQCLIQRHVFQCRVRGGVIKEKKISFEHSNLE